MAFSIKGSGDWLTNKQSVLSVIRTQKIKYYTYNNKAEDFKVGDFVRIIVPSQDFIFYNIEDTYGRVVGKSSNDIYPLCVAYSTRRDSYYKHGYAYFEPQDLKIYKSYDTILFRKQNGIKRFLKDRTFGGDDFSEISFTNPLIWQRNYLYVDIDKCFSKTLTHLDLCEIGTKELFKFFGFECIIINTGYKVYTLYKSGALAEKNDVLVRKHIRDISWYAR